MICTLAKHEVINGCTSFKLGNDLQCLLLLQSCACKKSKHVGSLTQYSHIFIARITFFEWDEKKNLPFRVQDCLVSNTLGIFTKKRKGSCSSKPLLDLATNFSASFFSTVSIFDSKRRRKKCRSFSPDKKRKRVEMTKSGCIFHGMCARKREALGALVGRRKVRHDVGCGVEFVHL